MTGTRLCRQHFLCGFECKKSAARSPKTRRRRFGSCLSISQGKTKRQDVYKRQDEFNKTSRDLERTFKEADPRPELKKARDDVKTALDDASKAAEHTLKDQPQQEE